VRLFQLALPKELKVFCFFFSKKKCFLDGLNAAHWHIDYTCAGSRNNAAPRYFCAPKLPRGKISVDILA
jgi:hypothetical protein